MAWKSHAILEFYAAKALSPYPYTNAGWVHEKKLTNERPMTPRSSARSLENIELHASKVQ